MKDNLNKIGDQAETHYELKKEYIDDLTKKLDTHRPKGGKGVYGIFGALLLFIFVGTCLLLPTDEDINSQDAVFDLSENQENSTFKSNTYYDEKDKNNLTENLTKATKPESEKEYVSVFEDYSVDNFNERKPSTPSVDIELKKHNSYDSYSNLSTKSKTKTTKGLYNKVKHKEEVSKPITGLNLETTNKTSSDIAQTEDKKTKLNIEIVDKGQDVGKARVGANYSDSIPDSSKKDLIENKNTEILITENEKRDSIAFTDKDTSINIDSSDYKKWRISILAGTNISFSRFTNAISQQYYDIRSSEEKYLATYSTGISIERFVFDKVKVSSGLNYISYGSNNQYTPVSTYNSERKFSRLDSSYVPVIDSMYYMPTRVWYTYLVKNDTIIDSIYTTTQIPNKDSTAFRSRGKASFSYVEVPLTIGYVKAFNNFELGINSGFSLGLLTKSSGYYIQENLTSVYQAKSNRLIINYLLSPEVSYSFKNHYYLGLQSFFRLGLNNLSISEPIDRRYYSLQFSAKIGYKF